MPSSIRMCLRSFVIYNHLMPLGLISPTFRGQREELTSTYVRCFCETRWTRKGEDPLARKSSGAKKLWKVLWVGGGNSLRSNQRSAATARMGKMALRRGRATSRCAGGIQTHHRKTAPSAVWLCLCLLLPSAAEAGLYSTSDQVVLLTANNVESVLVNSTAAVFAEFYASWCGHCVAFSPVYKSLAGDIKGWYGPATI